MEEQKNRVTKLEEQVLQTKKLYAESLQNLEQISDEIHQQREEQRIMRSLGSRESGVGAETPDPPHKVETPSPERAKPAKTASKAVGATSPSTPVSTEKTTTTTATSFAETPPDLPPPEISFNPPDSEAEEEEDEPELTAVVDFSDIKDSLKEIKESLSACTTPERGRSPIPQETIDDEEEEKEDAFQQPPLPTTPTRKSVGENAMPSVSPQGLASLGSEGNLNAFSVPRVPSGLSAASRSSSFHTRLGIARPLTACSAASSVDDLESETESLASVEMLGDQQIAMLMMDEEIAAMKRQQEEGGDAGAVGAAEDGDCAGEGEGGFTRRETDLELVLRSISLKHSVSLDKLKNIALNIKETSRKPVNLKDNGEEANLQQQ